MKVNFYFSGDPVHDATIQAFATGCPADDITLSDVNSYEPSDIAVVFGVFKKHVPKSFARGSVIFQQWKRQLDVVVLETGYVNRGDGPTHHYAAGLNGLNGRADFRNKYSLPDRWEKLGVQIKPWKQRCYPEGQNIYLIGQVPWDASVNDIVMKDWLDEAVGEIRKRTERPIIFKPHPKAPMPAPEGTILSTEPIKDAWAVVTFNSNTAVECALEGIPVLTFDEGSMAWDITDHGWNDICYPKLSADRAQWAANLAYTQWTHAEMRAGETWNHLFGSAT